MTHAVVLVHNELMPRHLQILRPSFNSPADTCFDDAQFPPARLDAPQTARILGFQPHDIPVLEAADLLEPLGKPAGNAVKYFAAVKVLALCYEEKWLHKATDVVYGHWKAKNAQKSKSATLVVLPATEASLAA